MEPTKKRNYNDVEGDNDVSHSFPTCKKLKYSVKDSRGAVVPLVSRKRSAVGGQANGPPKKRIQRLEATEPLGNVEGFIPKKKLIKKLNHDCLAKVLMYVPTQERLEMEKVCEKWKEASGLAWYNIKKFDFNELVVTLDKTEETLKKIMTRCCKYLTHLKINNNQYPWMANVLKNNCQNIIHFEINMTIEDAYKISNKDLVKIIASMTKLKYLKVLMKVDDASGNLGRKIVNNLPGDMHGIHLLMPNKNINKFNIPPVLDRFDGLHCLTLRGFYLTNATLESIMKNENTLVKFDLSYCKFSSCVLSIFSNLKNLEHLILWRIINLNVNEIISIARNCSKLKHFEYMNIRRNGEPKKLPYSIFRELSFLNLEYLNVYSIDRSSNDGKNQIAGLADNWKQMKHLNIEGGRNFSSLDFQEIIKFKHLEILNLREARINSEAFINIASNCLGLKELLMDYSKLLETTLEKLTNSKKLEKLHLQKCKNLTENLIFKISNNCKNLVDLDLAGCRNVTEASLVQVGKLQHLKRINIDNIKNVPNAMFNNLNKLEYLACFNCPSITDEGMIKVLNNCPKLSTLVVYSCGITDKTLVHASKRKFLFAPLVIYTNSSVKNDYSRQNTFTSSPYLIIAGR